MEGPGCGCKVWHLGHLRPLPGFPLGAFLTLGPKSTSPRTHACVPSAVLLMLLSVTCSLGVGRCSGTQQRNGSPLGQGVSTQSQRGAGPAQPEDSGV